MTRTHPSLAGTLLERRYRVDRLLARGGMSSVYRGTDTRLDRVRARRGYRPGIRRRQRRTGRITAAFERAYAHWPEAFIRLDIHTYDVFDVHHFRELGRQVDQLPTLLESR